MGLSAWDKKVRGLITDDGQGFDPAHTPTSVGLVGMRERVELLGGSLSVESSPGQGTRISFVLPLCRLFWLKTTPSSAPACACYWSPPNTP